MYSLPYPPAPTCPHLSSFLPASSTRFFPVPTLFSFFRLPAPSSQTSPLPYDFVLPGSLRLRFVPFFSVSTLPFPALFLCSFCSLPPSRFQFLHQYRCLLFEQYFAPRFVPRPLLFWTLPLAANLQSRFLTRVPCPLCRDVFAAVVPGAPASKEPDVRARPRIRAQSLPNPQLDFSNISRQAGRLCNASSVGPEVRRSAGPSESLRSLRLVRLHLLNPPPRPFRPPVRVRRSSNSRARTTRRSRHTSMPPSRISS